MHLNPSKIKASLVPFTAFYQLFGLPVDQMTLQLLLSVQIKSCLIALGLMNVPVRLVDSVSQFLGNFFEEIEVM